MRCAVVCRVKRCTVHHFHILSCTKSWPTENNAALALGDGELTAPIEQPATLAMDNTVTLPAGFTVTLKPGTGRFKGKFLHPLTGEPATFRGVILQKQNAGFGFFLSTAASGYATFTRSAILPMPRL